MRGKGCTGPFPLQSIGRQKDCYKTSLISLAGTKLPCDNRSTRPISKRRHPCLISPAGPTVAASKRRLTQTQRQLPGMSAWPRLAAGER